MTENIRATQTSHKYFRITNCLQQTAASDLSAPAGEHPQLLQASHRRTFTSKTTEYCTGFPEDMSWMRHNGCCISGPTVLPDVTRLSVTLLVFILIQHAPKMLPHKNRYDEPSLHLNM